MKDEASLWSNKIRPLIVNATIRCALDRIENGLAPGIPDVHYCLDGVSGWIELKNRAEPPKRASSIVFSGDHGLRNEQIAWLLRYHHAGGRAFIIAGIGDEAFILKAIPENVRTFNSLSRDDIAYRGTLIEARPLYWLLTGAR
jgi:hypothetical protein